MNTATALDSVALALMSLYLVFFTAALVFTAAAKTTLRWLTIGLRLQYTATILAALAALTHIVDIPHDGPTSALIWMFCCVGSFAIGAVMHRRRELKGEQVMHDGEKILRDGYQLPK